MSSIPEGPRASFELLGLPAAIVAALRTGILAELTKGAITEADLARRLTLDPRATALVLDLLVAHGWIVRDGDRVAPGASLSAMARGPGGYDLSVGLWAHVEEFVRTGEPYVVMDQAAQDRERAYRDVVGELATVFEASARDLAARLPLRPERVLDVGCGSGVWGLAVAERHPGAHVTGLDLPAVLEQFEARATALGLTERTASIASDMHTAELAPGAYDLAIIANVLRLETPERAASVIERIARAVAPGGAVLVVDALPSSTPDAVRTCALYALHLGLRTRSGQVHRPEQISSWLVRAGLPHVTSIELPTTAPVGALLARQT
jgi:ubiquinone/menaquinone biosynthesis C-methylase UbiE